MAARKKRTPLGKMHDARTREKIQTSQIVNRLKDHVLGAAKMSSTQVRAAEILLNKTLPNLQSTELKAEVDQTTKVISSEPLTENEWESKYGSNLASPSGPAESTH